MQKFKYKKHIPETNGPFSPYYEARFRNCGVCAKVYDFLIGVRLWLLLCGGVAPICSCAQRIKLAQCKIPLISYYIAGYLSGSCPSSWDSIICVGGQAFLKS